MIFRGTVSSESEASQIHRVKVTIPGICQDVLMDSVNGLYLRKGEDVYVYMNDEFLAPLIVGRCSGQFEISKLNDILNTMVDKFNSHFHPEYAALQTFAATCMGSQTDPVLVTAASTLSSTLLSNSPGKPTTQMSTTKNDDFLY